MPSPCPSSRSCCSGSARSNLARNPDGILALVADRRAGRRSRSSAPARSTPASATAARSTAGDAALALVGIRAGFGDVEVVHGVDLVVPDGAAVALLGANGAGKSTLALVAAGAIRPTGGAVFLGGDDVTALAPYARARRGLLVAPEARGVFPGLTVTENLAVLLDRAEREAAFERLPVLAGLRDRTAGLLSGGEQQLLALAPALVRPPRVLIADEPTLGLAPIAAGDIYAALAELRAAGTTLLLIEERADHALALADVVAFMDLGRVTWCGPRADVDAAALSAAYLGPTRG